MMTDHSPPCAEQREANTKIDQLLAMMEESKTSRDKLWCEVSDLRDDLQKIVGTGEGLAIALKVIGITASIIAALAAVALIWKH